MPVKGEGETWGSNRGFGNGKLNVTAGAMGKSTVSPPSVFCSIKTILGDRLTTDNGLSKAGYNLIISLFLQLRHSVLPTPIKVIKNGVGVSILS